MDRRDFFKTAASAAWLGCLPALAAERQARRRKPNFLIIFCDDLGYGDITPTGGKVIATPNIARLAAEGTTFTDFYAAANLCTPSRAGLLTGRYPIRTGLAYSVIAQNDTRGLPLGEVTIAEALQPDYASALIGKWHLGHIAPYWPPTQQGFDLFFGLPYSHDMKPLSLFTAGKGIEFTKEDVDFPQLQQRFCARAERFIEEHAKRPFFLELALSSPHLPNYPPHDHVGTTRAGAYGDVVHEIDSIVGRLMAKLRELDLDRDTLLIFTSDNGPWYEGSSGGLRDRKGGAGYDGGYRVPMIVRQPGVIPAGRRSGEIGMSIDLLPTFCAMAGLPLPSGAQLDGLDITEMLQGTAPSPHDQLVLFDNEDVAAIRTQRWKYVGLSYFRRSRSQASKAEYPQLYDMQLEDPESYSVATLHPDVLADMKRRYAEAVARFAPLKSKNPPENLFPPRMDGPPLL